MTCAVGTPAFSRLGTRKCSSWAITATKTISKGASVNGSAEVI